MADYVYTKLPAKIRPLLEKVRGVGVPSKVTSQWMKSIGFTSSNDTSLVGVLKFIGFIDGTGVPTSQWSKYRGPDHKRVLGEAVQEGYAELFALYPNANMREQSELEHVFRTSSTAGQQVVALTARTFKALADLAEFTETVDSGESQLNTQPLHVPVAARPSNVGEPTGSREPSLHIDIQVHISPEASPEQIEMVFASMARHLYGRKTDG